MVLLGAFRSGEKGGGGKWRIMAEQLVSSGETWKKRNKKEGCEQYLDLGVTKERKGKWVVLYVCVRRNEKGEQGGRRNLNVVQFLARPHSGRRLDGGGGKGNRKEKIVFRSMLRVKEGGGGWTVCGD